MVVAWLSWPPRSGVAARGRLPKVPNLQKYLVLKDIARLRKRWGASEGHTAMDPRLTEVLPPIKKVLTNIAVKRIGSVQKAAPCA